MKKIILYSIFLILALPVNCLSRGRIIPRYSFINYDKDVIENDASLKILFDKLIELKAGIRKKVSIVHIGDSHVQADFFSGNIRMFLQDNFGNGGRGLIFPYGVAESNEPEDIKSDANNCWQWRRSVKIDNQLPIGVSGYTLYTESDTAWLRIKVLNPKDAFNKITIFHNKGNEYFDFVIKDEYGKSIGYAPSFLKILPYSSIVPFKEKHQEIIIQCRRNVEEQKSAYIYGVVFDNGERGVIYNTIAANGAAFYHYNCAQYFNQQLEYLQPDLIIVSLGTNEALHPPFSRKLFWNQIELFTKRLTRNNQDVCLLFTSPPDSYLQGVNVNNNTKLVTEALISFCENNDLAYFDLFNIMGGTGSMLNWEKEKMVQIDRIHYTYKGYMTQADLFNQAFINSFKKYNSR